MEVFMWKIFKCRRSSLAVLGMVILAGLGAYLKVDTSGAIAMIVMGVAVSNAGQAVGESIIAKKQSEE